jgi:hypothetical protein
MQIARSLTVAATVIPMMATILAAEPPNQRPGEVKVAAVQICGYDKGAEVLVWINGRGGTVEDFIVKSVTFQSHVAMICTNQAYGGGTMIADWPTRIVARCPDRKEAYITGSINLEQVRKARKFSRNFQQRRPDLYGELVKGGTLPQQDAAPQHPKSMAQP